MAKGNARAAVLFPYGSGSTFEELRIWNSDNHPMCSFSHDLLLWPLSAPVAGRGATANSGAHVVFRRFTPAGRWREASSVATEKYPVCNVLRACFRQRQPHLVT